MNIYVRSDNLAEISTATEAGLADGILYAGSGNAEHDPTELSEIVAEFALPVCVAVGAMTTSDMYREARELSRLSDRIIVQVPLVEDAVPVIRKLTVDGVDVCANFIFNAAQAAIAARAGAGKVLVSVPDLDSQGQSVDEVLGDIRAVFDRTHAECDLMASGPRSAAEFTSCILAGADIICITPALLKSLILHPSTDRALDRFLNDAGKRGKPRSST